MKIAIFALVTLIFIISPQSYEAKPHTERRDAEVRTAKTFKISV